MSVSEQLGRPLERIVRLDDPRLDDYRDIREKDLAIRRSAFIVESEVVLRVFLARSRYPIRSVFVAEARLPKLADALAGVPAAIPIYVAEQALLDEVVGFHIHRGVLASGERTEVASPEEWVEALRPGPERVVVLEGLTNHDNVGGVFRNAAAFGAGAVLLDQATCDPLYRKAIRVSVGGAVFVPFVRGTTALGIVEALKRASFHCLALSPRADATPVHQLGELPPRVAVVLGSEGPGLSDAVMAAADALVRIDMAPGFDSLNVATTSGIALHAVRR